MPTRIVTDPENIVNHDKKTRYWKLRSSGFEDLIIKHNWSMKSGFGEKLIGGRLYMQFIVEDCDSHKLVKFIPKDVFWNKIHDQIREEETIVRRSAMYGIAQT
jgi:hypothetical protein